MLVKKIFFKLSGKPNLVEHTRRAFSLGDREIRVFYNTRRTFTGNAAHEIGTVCRVGRKAHIFIFKVKLHQFVSSKKKNHPRLIISLKPLRHYFVISQDHSLRPE